MDRFQNLVVPAHLLMIMLYGMLVGLAISLIPVILIYLDFQRIPRGFRKIEPGLVFLLLIPCFHLVWNFFVFPGLSDSFKAYFNSIGDNSVGTCGRELGLGYAISVAVSAIPFVGCLTGIVALVLLILFLVKANELKNRIPRTA
jgi:hypothetical protein